MVTEEKEPLLTHVRKVGKDIVHEMVSDVAEDDSYSTVCGQMLYCTESDLTSDPVTCKRCLSARDSIESLKM